VEGERRKRRLWPWLVALAVLGGLAAYNYWPAEPDKIIISRETTYILGPLNPDGTPNYVKYLDDKYSQGVTAENNAAPLLLRAIGPEMLPAEIRSETLRRLNLPAEMFDDNDAKYFTKWKDRARARSAKADANAAGDAKDANSPAHTETDEDESANEPNVNGVFEMLLAGQVHPDLEAWLTSNAGPLELVCQATDKDRFYLPLVSTSTPPMMLEVMLPGLQRLQQSAWALAARSILKMMRDDSAGAWDDVLAVHRMARLLGKDTPILVICFVASGIDEIVGRAGIILATRRPMGAAQAREVLGKLNALVPATDIVRTIDEEDRFGGLDAVMALSRGADVHTLLSEAQFKRNERNKLHLDTNRMLRDMNSWFDRLVKPLRLPRFQGRTEAQKAFDDEFKAFAVQTSNRMPPLRIGLLKFGGRLMRQAMTDVMSDWLVCNMMPSVAGACNLEDEAKMAYEIETLAVALACFHAEHSRWPAELKELCPSLLKQIPADRFSVNPLIYRPGEKGYLLYSVGRNLRDDGGQRERIVGGKVVNEGADDIAAEVPAKPS
jgi:hypothetical protein